MQNPPESPAVVGTASVVDALDELGVDGVLEGPRMIVGHRPFLGPAVTVRLEAGSPGPEDGRRLWGAVDSAAAGSVVVLATGGAEVSALGGVTAGTAAARGLAGLVTDGLIRDADEIEDYGLPVHCRGGHPRAIRPRCSEPGVPVRFGDVEVVEGDLIVADGDGVVRVPHALIADVLERARRIEKLERLWVERARAQLSIADGFASVSAEFGAPH